MKVFDWLAEQTTGARVYNQILSAARTLHKLRGEWCSCNTLRSAMQV